MVYPSHYMRGVYNLKHPNSEPYQVIRRAMQDALRRSAPLGETAEIRPYLQAFTLGAAALHARRTCGSRSAPRRSWASTPGCSGTPAARTTPASSGPKTAAMSVGARSRPASPSPGTN